MNCLVLGGNGFIGSHLVDKLLTEGHRVRVFDKYEEHFRKPLTAVDYRYGDFGNRGLLTEALMDMDTVLHLISTTLPKTSNDDPVFDVQSNVIETLFLLEQCVAQKIKKIIFISSGGTIYGKPSILPIPENSPADPECSYGITKLTIEKYLALFNRLYGLEYTILRPSNVYGERQNPEGIQGAISVFLGKVARSLPIQIWGDGTVVRDYIYIADLVEAVSKAANIMTLDRIFNIGSGKGIALNEIMEVICQVTKREACIEYQEKRSFDVPAIYLDVTRVHQQLNWSATTPIEEGIKRTWDFIQGSNII
ncbi:MAG: NAD-dependent epimerase [Desulfovibrio sp. S3730MH75]|nr:MAG: NAD-dependent epimerase [Desulfovibrio sp. S3730MH75]